jgi:hypothetical protein
MPDAVGFEIDYLWIWYRHDGSVGEVEVLRWKKMGRLRLDEVELHCMNLSLTNTLGIVLQGIGLPKYHTKTEHII